MSNELVDHSPDLKKLQEEGFEIEIKAGYLMVHSIPYVNEKGEVVSGILVSTLDMTPERTVQPQDHKMHFMGAYPHNHDGSEIKEIQSTSQNQDLGNGIIINHTFSHKFADRMYEDYYEKVTTYIDIIEPQAKALDPYVTAKTMKVIHPNDPNIVFNYYDTNSSRAGIGAITTKLQALKVAIVGLGGTGSYVLDFVAKTQVSEIHLFDAETFLLHNAFRAPGAPSRETLDQQLKKVAYLQSMYANMHKHIVPHEYHLVESTLDDLSDMDFVFICIDNGKAKKLIIERLLETNTQFVDVGIGVELENGALSGSIRATTASSQKSDHITQQISFTDGGDDDYSQNIQIAELNAINAALAVIKWKKLFGFYHDLKQEHQTVYTTNNNQLVNDENIS